MPMCTKLLLPVNLNIIIKLLNLPHGGVAVLMEMRRSHILKNFKLALTTFCLDVIIM